MRVNPADRLSVKFCRWSRKDLCDLTKTAALWLRAEQRREALGD